MAVALFLAAGITPLVLGYYLGVFTGAPYVPTNRALVERMLDLARVGADTTLVDLGSGDGRIVIAAARRGARATGYEINPSLVRRARRAAERAGVNGRARFVRKNFHKADFAAYDVVTIYGVTSIMRKLEGRLQSDLHQGARVVSHAFTFPHWQGRSEGDLHVYEQTTAEAAIQS